MTARPGPRRLPRRSRGALLATALLVAGPSLLQIARAAADAGTAGRSITPAIRPAADAILEKAHAEAHFSGVALVARGGEILYRRAFGLADRAWEVPHQDRSRFRIGSLTKQFTAALVLRLVEERTIDLDAPLGRYLPDYPAPARERITIRHLLTHTSGIPDVTRRPDLLEIVRDPATPGQVVSRWCSEPPAFRPGSRFEYSNCGYLVLGLVYETVTGQPHRRGVDELAADAGLSATGYAGPQEVVPRLAEGYITTPRGFARMPYIDWSVGFASGSLYSTAGDLARWTRALARGEILSPESREMMFSPQVDGYGVGWHVGTVIPETVGEFLARDEGATAPRPGDIAIASHGGDLPGFHSRVTYLPERDEVVVLLDNHDSHSLGALSAAIVRALLR